MRGVRERLGWPGAADEILTVWDGLDLPRTPVALPAAPDVIRILHLMGADEIDVADVVGARPDPVADPELWWVLERCVAHLRAEMGGQGMLSWPSMADQDDAAARLTYVWAFLAHLPEALAYHERRGVPAEVSWATFADVGEKLRINRQIHGRVGLDVAFWFTLHFRGSIYRLGRLQFDLHRDADGVPLLGVHIPETGGPLSPAACDESFARAARFYPALFADHPAERAACHSWLLDPRLGKVLPARSNIAAFGRRFALEPAAESAGHHGTLDVLRFVFKRVVASPDRIDPATLPRTNTLERALADHLAAGGRWEQRAGHVPL